MATVSAKELPASLSPFWGRAAYWSRVFARVVLVVAFSVYATAKFAGAQFITAGGTLDKPVADLSGINLTWVYFGHSSLYANFVALGQLAAAALLSFDRTARLGAALLFPITANIVAVNFGYRIGADTQIVSLILLALNVYLLVWDLPAWKRLLWDETADDPTRPKFMGRRAAGVVRAAAFAATVAGVHWLLASQSSGGLSPVSGEWLVESATIDGRRITDPAMGAGWRWICFDPHGQLSVRTNRYTFLGRYTAEAAGDKFTVRYDPEPLPPIYPGQSLSAHMSPAEVRRVVGEQAPDFKWPIELVGTYRKDGDKLVVRIRRGEEKVEWILTPYARPKF
jgi:hypothetical protein